MNWKPTNKLAMRAPCRHFVHHKYLSTLVKPACLSFLFSTFFVSLLKYSVIIRIEFIFLICVAHHQLFEPPSSSPSCFVFVSPVASTVCTPAWEPPWGCMCVLHSRPILCVCVSSVHPLMCSDRAVWRHAFYNMHILLEITGCVRKHDAGCRRWMFSVIFRQFKRMCTS